jgi:hypothetical protein
VPPATVWHDANRCGGDLSVDAGIRGTRETGSLFPIECVDGRCGD